MEKTYQEKKAIAKQIEKEMMKVLERWFMDFNSGKITKEHYEWIYKTTMKDLERKVYEQTGFAWFSFR